MEIWSRSDSSAKILCCLEIIILITRFSYSLILSIHSRHPPRYSLRTLPRQTADTIHHILERLLVLVRRIRP